MIRENSTTLWPLDDVLAGLPGRPVDSGNLMFQPRSGAKADGRRRGPSGAPSSPKVLQPHGTTGVLRDWRIGTKTVRARTRCLYILPPVKQLFGDAFADGVPEPMRTFGGNGKSGRCDTRLTLPLDKPAVLRRIKGLKADRQTRTLLAAALLAVADDLAGVTVTRTRPRHRWQGVVQGRPGRGHRTPRLSGRGAGRARCRVRRGGRRLRRTRRTASTGCRGCQRLDRLHTLMRYGLGTIRCHLGHHEDLTLT